MRSLANKKTKIVIISFGAFLMALVLALSGLGIYFKLHPKTKDPAKVNPLDFSIDAWDGKTVDGLNFNESYAGRGSQTKTINSAASFIHFVNEVNSGNSFENYTIYLNSNIDLKGYTINSIGTEAHPFKGVFDGGFYTIFNANVNGDGLFNITGNATIKNVGLYNSNTNLVGKAINTNIENVYLRLGNGVIANEYSSINGEHHITNSFVDTTANGLINKLDTNNSSENEVVISNCYFTKGNEAVNETVAETYVEENSMIKATSKDDFATWSYSKNYSAEKDWCDYDYLKNTEKLDFTYPIQSGFVKVFLTGSCYESVVVTGDTYVDASDLAAAFVEADKETEAEVNLLVDKIFMDAEAEVNNAEITVNAINDTTIVRGENNTNNLFVSNGTSKVTLGDSDENAKTITIDGNRANVESKEKTTGALIVANGGEVEIHENVVLKDNINNTENGYGGAVVVYNGTKANINANIENCSATYGGAIAYVNDNNVSTASTSDEIEAVLENVNLSNNTAVKGGAIYVGENVNLTVSNVTLENNNASENGGSIYAEGAIKVADDVVIKNNNKDELGYAEIYAKDKIEVAADVIFDTNSKNTAAIRITENNYVDLTRIPNYRIKLYKENISVYEEGSANGLIFKYSRPTIVSTAAEENTDSSQTFDVVNLPEGCTTSMNSDLDGIVSIAATTPSLTFSEPNIYAEYGEIKSFSFSSTASGTITISSNDCGFYFEVDGVACEEDQSGRTSLTVSITQGTYYTCELDTKAGYIGWADLEFYLDPTSSSYSNLSKVLQVYVGKAYPTVTNTNWEYDSTQKVEYGKSITSVFQSNTAGTLGYVGMVYTSIEITSLGWDSATETYVWDVVITGSKIGIDNLSFVFIPSNTNCYYSMTADGVPACKIQVIVKQASLGFYLLDGGASWPDNPPVFYHVLNGSACTITFTSSDTSIVQAPSSVSISAAGTSGMAPNTYATAVGIGSATITATCTPTDSNYATETATCTVTVEKGIPNVTISGSTTLYVGSQGALNYQSDIPGTFVITSANTSYVQVGSYEKYAQAGTSYSVMIRGVKYYTSVNVTISFTPADSDNYNTYTTTKTYSVYKNSPTITLSPTSLSVEILGSNTFTYKSSIAGTFSISSRYTDWVTVDSGYTKTATAGTTYTCTINGVAIISSATITVLFTPTDTAKYSSTSKTVLVTVTAPANGVEKPTAVNNYVYTGSAIILTGSDITGFDSDKMTIVSGNSYTAKGSYNVYIGLKSGYKWMDGTTSNISLPWQITGNVVQGVTLSTGGDYVYGGLRPTPTVSSNPDYAKVTYYVNITNSTTGGTDWSTLTSTSLNVGTYYMYAVIAESPNYDETTTNPVSFSITKATPVFTVNGITTSTSYIEVGSSSGSATTITVMSSVAGTLSTTTSTGLLNAVTVSTAFPTTMTANTSYSGAAYMSSVFSSGAGSISFTFTPTNTTNYVSVSHTVNTKKSYSTLAGTITITLDGDPVVGETLTASSSSTTAVAYQWYYNTTNSTSSGLIPLNGATSTTLTLSNDLFGKYVCVGVTHQQETTYSTRVDYKITSTVVKQPTELTLSHGGMINMAWYDDMKLTFTAPCEGSFSASTLENGGTNYSPCISIGATYYDVYQFCDWFSSTGTTATVWLMANGTELGTSSIQLTFTPTDTTGMYAKSITYIITVNVEQRIVDLPEDSEYEWTGSQIWLYHKGYMEGDLMLNSGLYSFDSSNLAQTEIGSYVMSVSLNSSNGQCMWADGTTTSKTYTATITQQTLPNVANLAINKNTNVLSWTAISKENASISYTIDIKEYDETTESYVTWRTLTTTSASYDLSETLKEYDGDKTSLYVCVTTNDLLGTYYKDSVASNYVSIDEIYQITLVKGEGIADILVDGVLTTSFAYIAGQTHEITALAMEHYKFKEWTETAAVIDTSKTASLITIGSVGANATLTATAEINSYKVTFAVNDLTAGTVSRTELYVSSSSMVSVSGNTISIGGVTITATPANENAEYTYAFSSWTNATGNITADRTITANFTKTKKQYTVTIVKNIDSYGTLSQSSVTVDYGTIISKIDNILSIGTTDITATPATATVQYVYSFDGWEGVQNVVTTNTTIIAKFSRGLANCSVKLEYSDSYVSSTHADSFEVEYGSKIYVSDNVLLIGDESIVFTLADADAQYEYVLHLEVNNASIVSGSTLTGAMTVMVSAERVERTYTVSIGTNNSSYGSVSSTTIANVAYGSTIEIEGNKIVIKKGGTTVATITATAKSGYEFDKWIGVVGHVNGNISITASFA